MDWKVSRSSEELWKHVRQLKDNSSPSSSLLFNDIVIHCSDGALPWNRICLALTFSSCRAVLDRELNSEAELAVSLPDFTVCEARKLLEASLPKTSAPALHPALTPSSVSYTLVPHMEEGAKGRLSPEEVEDEETFFDPGSLDSESECEEKPDVDDLKRKVENREKKPERQRSRTSKGVLISNDLADCVQVECKICGVRRTRIYLRKSHVEKVHNMSITEYKTRYGDLNPVENVLHRCAICDQLIQLDSDLLNHHLRREDHKMSTRDYKEQYMVDTRAKDFARDFEERKEVYNNGPSTAASEGWKEKRKRLHEENDQSDIDDCTDLEFDTSNGAITQRFGNVENLKKLNKQCKVALSNYKLTEDEVEEGGVELEDAENSFFEAKIVEEEEEEEPKIKAEPGVKKKRKIEELEDSEDEEDSDFDEECDIKEDWEESDEEENFIQEKKGGKTKRTPNKNQVIEQLSVDVTIPGLMDSLKHGGPYVCVIASCNRTSYHSASYLRKHYASHDPEMHSALKCPECQYVQADERPTGMKKHIAEKHGRDEEWATANMIVEVSEKLKEFRKASAIRVIGVKQRVVVPSKTGKRHSALHNERKRRRFTRLKISLEDPAIRASFATGGSDNKWLCAVPGCNHSAIKAYELKRHYGKHDKTLRKDALECNHCSFIAWIPRNMEKHLKTDHLDVRFLAEAGQPQYRVVEGDNWVEFNDRANEILADNPNCNRKGFEDIGGHWREKRLKRIENELEFHIPDRRCSFCPQIFNTQNALEDHEKIHRPHLINHTCPHCTEGFAVQSVFDFHLKSHTGVLYDSLGRGVVRCNGCSLNFENVKEVKSHLSTHHLNLLEKCHICEHCSEWFTGVKPLRAHMFKHVEAYRCPNCPKKKFFSQEEVDTHMALGRCVYMPEECVCSQCGQVCTSKHNLKNHIQAEHEEKLYRYQCVSCRTLYLSMSLMRLHIRKTHKVTTGSIKDHYIYYSKEEAKLLDVETLNAKKPKGRGGKGTGEQYPCPFGCGKTFSRNGLKRHKDKCESIADGNQEEDSPINLQDYRFAFSNR